MKIGPITDEFLVVCLIFFLNLVTDLSLALSNFRSKKISVIITVSDLNILLRTMYYTIDRGNADFGFTVLTCGFSM